MIMIGNYLKAGLMLGLVFLFVSACGQSALTVRAADHDASSASDRPMAVSDQRLYVCNQGSATVAVIDIETFEVIHTVDLQAYGFSSNAKPHHITVEPDGSFWYLSLIGEGKVLKFNREYELVGQADFEVPGMMALHAERDLLFVGRSMSAVNPPQGIGVIQRSEMSIEEVDVLFPRPHALAVDPRGEFVFTASLALNQFLTLNIDTEEITLGSVEGETHTFVQFAISPDGHTMVASGQLTGQLLVFDTEDPNAVRLAKSIPVNAEPWHPVFSPDGRHVYVGNKSANTVTVIDVDSWQVSSVIEGNGLSQPHGIAVSPDGKYVFISNNNLKGAYTPQHESEGDAKVGTLAVIDTGANKIVKVIEVGLYPTGVGTRAR